MNRRTFTSLAGLSALLGTLPPLAARAADSLRLSAEPPRGWGCLDDCAASCGRRYRASGPASASLELVSVSPGQAGNPRQFTAHFHADRPLREGVYLLRGRRTSMALFLQPATGDATRVEAAFNLV